MEICRTFCRAGGLAAINIKIEIADCRMLRGEFGMKRILTILVDIEMIVVCSILMMVLFLLHTIITLHFMKSDWRESYESFYFGF